LGWLIGIAQAAVAYINNLRSLTCIIGRATQDIVRALSTIGTLFFGSKSKINDRAFRERSARVRLTKNHEYFAHNLKEGGLGKCL
jgi:hypothetical protein